MTPSGRALTDIETAILRAILRASPVDDDVLLSQLGHAAATSNWAPAGSPSFDMEIASGPAPARLPNGPLPVRAEVHDAQDEYTGELIVWITGGFISALEYAWITDEVPHSLPELASLQISAEE